MSEVLVPKVISFVDKQLQLTQKRHAELESSLSEVLAAIEDNARLQLNLHDLTLEVMRAPTLSDAIMVMAQGLKSRFELRDVQVWGQEASPLPRAIPTVSMTQFLSYMQANAVAFGHVSAFPTEAWRATGVVSGCAFRLSGVRESYGVLLLGRTDDEFSQTVDVLFLQQFVELMGLWFERLGADSASHGLV